MSVFQRDAGISVPPEDEHLRVARAANVPGDEHAGAVHVREAVQIFLNE